MEAGSRLKIPVLLTSYGPFLTALVTVETSEEERAEE